MSKNETGVGPHQLKIGQKVFIEDLLRGGGLVEDEIAIVGKKWFFARKSRFPRFNIQNLFSDGKGFNSRYKIHLDLDEYNAQVRRNKLIDEIRRNIDKLNRLPIGNIERIASDLGITL